MTTDTQAQPRRTRQPTWLLATFSAASIAAVLALIAFPFVALMSSRAGTLMCGCAIPPCLLIVAETLREARRRRERLARGLAGYGPLDADDGWAMSMGGALIVMMSGFVGLIFGPISMQWPMALALCAAAMVVMAGMLRFDAIEFGLIRRKG